MGSVSLPCVVSHSNGERRILAGDTQDTQNTHTHRTHTHRTHRTHTEHTQKHTRGQKITRKEPEVAAATEVGSASHADGWTRHALQNTCRGTH